MSKEKNTRNLVNILSLDVVKLQLYTHYASTAKQLTLTFSNVTGQVEDALIPSLFSFFPTCSPSVSRSTMKHVIPLYP